MCSVYNVENVLKQTSNIVVSPNPFNQVTNFKIELIEGGDFQLQIFNAKGAMIVNNNIALTQGINNVEFDGSSLSTGAYSYRLVNASGYTSGKLILVK